MGENGPSQDESRNWRRTCGWCYHQYLALGEDDGGRDHPAQRQSPGHLGTPLRGSEPATREGEMTTLPLKTAGVEGSVVVKPFILPRRRTTSPRPMPLRRQRGPKGWNAQQGLAVHLPRGGG